MPSLSLLEQPVVFCILGFMYQKDFHAASKHLQLLPVFPQAQINTNLVKLEHYQTLFSLFVLHVEVQTKGSRVS